MPKLSEDLAQPLRTMQECARRIAKVSLECKLELDEDEYVQVSFKLFFFIVFFTCSPKSPKLVVLLGS